MKTTLIYAITRQGAELSLKLAEHIPADIIVSKKIDDIQDVKHFDSLSQAVLQNFLLYNAHIFIAATGIVVRTLAPCLDRKDRDPAVIVLDQKGRFVISLLSGHLGRANVLTKRIASITNGQAVITTATDVEGIKAIDVLAQEKGLHIANIQAIKTINAALLENKLIHVYDPEYGLQEELSELPGYRIRSVSNLSQIPIEGPGIVVTWQEIGQCSSSSVLCLHPPCLVLGLGCNSKTPASEIIELISRTLSDYSLSVQSIYCLATTTKKKDEPGLIQAAKDLGLALKTINHDNLKSITVPNPSQVVENYMGVSSICEATALIESGAKELIVPKTKSLNATLAIAVKH